MSEPKKTSSHDVRLRKPHTHAGQPYAVGEVIPADQLSRPIADWLVQNGIGEKSAAAPAAKAIKE